MGLKAVSISLQAGSFYTACTGAGAPIALWLQGGSLGVSLVSMIVGELPCDNAATDEKIKAMAKAVVCETLENNGVECQPDDLKQVP